MREPLIGEIQLFAGDYAPHRWAFCDGRILKIADYTALFAVIGNRYGGDGQHTFALPDLRGRVAMHCGAGPGLTLRTLGKAGGQASVALTEEQMPAHTHLPMGVAGGPGKADPKGKVWGAGSTALYRAGQPALDVAMSKDALQSTGQGKPHENRQPYLALNYCIAVQGTFPIKG